MYAIYAQEGDVGPEAILCEVELVDFCLCVLTEDEDHEVIDFSDVCLLGFCHEEDFYPEDWQAEAEEALEIALLEELDEGCDCDDPDDCAECSEIIELHF